jgi:hypothetical protein
LAGEKENIPGVLPPWKLELEWGREGDCEGATVKNKNKEQKLKREGKNHNIQYKISLQLIQHFIAVISRGM